MTFFDGFSRKPRAAARARSPSATGLRVCDSRVVPRTMTGVSNCSEISNASRVKSSASWASLGSSTGTVASCAVDARVLLVLRAVNAGIVAHGEHQPAVHADVGLRHEGVGGDVEADMLHGGERALAGERSADRHVERDLFVGRPLRVQVLGRVVGQRFEDFGARRAGIGGGDLDAGLPGAARDRFVAGQRADVFGLAAGCSAASSAACIAYPPAGRCLVDSSRHHPLIAGRT